MNATMQDSPQKTTEPGGSLDRLVSRDRILKAETLAAMLVKNGMIDIAAVEDPEGYDNWRTWNAIRDVASEITKAANNQAEP